MSFCAIDFGTSNSAIALPAPDGVQLAPVEGSHLTLPTAVFFNTDEDSRAFGRAALAAYIDGYDGRLMRSLKSILGSELADAATELGNGASVRFLDVIGLFLSHLKASAQARSGQVLTQAVLGRPVFFVDDDPVADRAAQAQLEAAARSVGFRDVAFQFEPIAAALDYEARVASEQLVLVADLGGGTSDFSLVRVGPDRAARAERRDDVLAHHGVHVAGTDYDRRVALAAILTELGYGAIGTDGRELPSRVYHDLATWHLINTVYSARRIGELTLMRYLYADVRYHERLMRVAERRHGHALAAHAEALKIGVADGGAAQAALPEIEAGLSASLDEAGLVGAGADDTRRIVEAALHTVALAGVEATDVNALYFTGGSTGLRFLSAAIASAFPAAQPVFGERLASVAAGLGRHAAVVFGAPCASADMASAPPGNEKTLP